MGSVDKYQVGNGETGPVVARLREQLFRQAVQGDIPAYAGWSYAGPFQRIKGRAGVPAAVHISDGNVLLRQARHSHWYSFISSHRSCEGSYDQQIHTPEAVRLAGRKSSPTFPPRDDMQNYLHLYLPRSPRRFAAPLRHFRHHCHTRRGSRQVVSPARNGDIASPTCWLPLTPTGASLWSKWVILSGSKASRRTSCWKLPHPTTGQEDYTGKRRDYAAFGISEYWRFRRFRRPLPRRPYGRRPARERRLPAHRHHPG